VGETRITTAARADQVVSIHEWFTKGEAPAEGVDTGTPPLALEPVSEPAPAAPAEPTTPAKAETKQPAAEPADTKESK
jgi:hypothetical protein